MVMWLMEVSERAGEGYTGETQVLKLPDDRVLVQQRIWSPEFLLG